MDDTPVLRRRIHFLDEVRGFDLILMVFFHGFYMLGWIYDVAFGRTLFQFFRPVQPLFAGLFIFICGISCYLSHSNARRGLILAGISVGISLFLYLFMRDEMIWFGILHFLAVSILLFAALRPLLSKVSPLAGIAVVCRPVPAHLSHVARAGQLVRDQGPVYSALARKPRRHSVALPARDRPGDRRGLFSPAALVFLFPRGQLRGGMGEAAVFPAGCIKPRALVVLDRETHPHHLCRPSAGHLCRVRRCDVAHPRFRRVTGDAGSESRTARDLPEPGMCPFPGFVHGKQAAVVSVEGTEKFNGLIFI